MAESTEFFAALAQAQSEFKTPVKNRINPHFKNRYADLQSILDAVRPALNRHGISLLQKATSEAGAVSVETILAYKDGTQLSSGVLRLPVAQNNAQQFGSAETYARRYSISAFLGVASDEDDDANAASPQPQSPQPSAPQITAEQRQMWRNAAAEGKQTFREFFRTRTQEERSAFHADSDFKAECERIAANADAREAA